MLSSLVVVAVVEIDGAQQEKDRQEQTFQALLLLPLLRSIMMVLMMLGAGDALRKQGLRSRSRSPTTIEMSLTSAQEPLREAEIASGPKRMDDPTTL